MFEKLQFGVWEVRVIVMAIQPRTRWDVDHFKLLEKVQAQLSRLAEKNGYDYLLMSANKGERSNRLDMIDAIRAKNYPVFKFENFISGTIFHGNEFQESVVFSDQRQRQKSKGEE